MDKRMSVALCSYNGEKYIEAQLKSIIEQTLLPDEIIICDDGSTDTTLKIISEYFKEYKSLIKIYKNPERLGVVGNFSQCLSLCEGQYIALSDQDDIWVHDKLEQAMLMLKKAEDTFGEDEPLLVHSDLSVIDEEGQLLNTSFISFSRLDPNSDEPLKILPVQNFVTGCSTLINEALLKIALPIPEIVMMHDWWLALVAAATGQIVYNTNKTVFYRQHNQNVVGANSYYSNESLKIILNVKLLENELACAINQLKALQHRLSEVGLANSLEDIKVFVDNMEKGGIKAFNGALKSGIKKTGLVRNFVLYLLLLKGGYVNKLNAQ